ncbi:hypothetical protein PIB30_006465 [Stylosanthes scabra]|uniref:Uncharacterized protein n=1 Tax=Stylosanthes scabra TaxID=79078 RepID=A0ABU6U3U2_9FABA|nr:hypothetical protein [Stylosanthes scabra]
MCIPCRSTRKTRFKLFLAPTRPCEGKVTQVYRRKGVIPIKRIMREKAKGRAAANKEKGTKFAPEDISQTID